MLKALPGCALLDVDAVLSNREGLIYVPTIGRAVKGKSGRCISRTLWTEQPAWVWKFDKKSNRTRKMLVSEPWRDNWMFENIEGKRLVFETYSQFVFGKQILANVRFEHIVGEIEEGAEIKIMDEVGGIERCPRCRTKGELNMMLDSSGYCPCCGLNKRGDRRDGKPDNYGIPLSDKITEDQVEAFNPAPKIEKGTIFSYPGVK